VLNLNAFTANDAMNKASFEKEGAPMIALGVSGGEVVACGGGKRGLSAGLIISRKSLPVAKQVLKNGGDCRRSVFSAR